MDNIKKFTDDYGFKSIEVTPKEGGRIKITNFGKEYNVDVGSISMINQHGLGSSNWIRKREDIPGFKMNINQVVWIEEYSKKELISFLEEF